MAKPSSTKQSASHTSKAKKDRKPNQPPPKHQRTSGEIATAIAKRTKDVLGAQPSDENVGRIAYAAEVYARLYCRSSGVGRHKADARVAKSVERLRAALAQSAEYHDTFSIVLGPECESALADVERRAGELSKKARSGQPRDLRRVCDVVLDAFWEVDKAKIGKSGISTNRSTNMRYGVVLELVKDALRLAGVRYLPSDETIRNAAAAASKAKINNK